MLEESVVYQDILRKGKRQGLQQEGKTIAVRQLERRFGKLSPAVRRELERLAVAQLEDWCVALLGFQSKEDLTRWLKQQA